MLLITPLAWLTNVLVHKHQIMSKPTPCLGRGWKLPPRQPTPWPPPSARSPSPSSSSSSSAQAPQPPRGKATSAPPPTPASRGCTAATAGPASTRSQPPSTPSRALLHLAGGAEHRPPVQQLLLAHYAQLLLHLGAAIEGGGRGRSSAGGSNGGRRTEQPGATGRSGSGGWRQLLERTNGSAQAVLSVSRSRVEDSFL